MAEDEERWAEALAIERWKGTEAARFLAQRIEALAVSGDEAGVARLTAIADRLDRLRDGIRQ